MSLKPLIKGQTLKIDDHHWGSGEEKKWDDTRRDVHIDKRTQYKIDGKYREVIIKVPINSDTRNISIISGSKRIEEVPKKLKQEIEEALNNEVTRNLFINDLVKILSNYSSIASKSELASDALNRLSKHFELNWTKQLIQNIIDGELVELTQLYIDAEEKQYYMKIDGKRIQIGEVGNWERKIMRVKR